MQRVVVAILCLMIPSSALAADRYLIPINYSGPGAAGSRWRTQIALANTSQIDVPMPGFTVWVGCPFPEGCFSDILQAQTGGFLYGPQLPRGAFVSIPPTDPPISMALRVAEASRYPYISGTSIPLPNEREFVATSVRLGAVPIEHSGSQPAFRTMLRIYALPESHDVTVSVAQSFPFWAESSGPAIDVFLNAPDREELPVQPWFAAVDASAFRDSDQDSWGDIVVTPLPDAAGEVPRIWAFTSTVWESSGEIMVVSPMATSCR